MLENLFKIHSPPVKFDELVDIRGIWADSEVQAAIKKANTHYLHWDDLKNKDWLPSERLPDKTLFWTLVKVERQFGSRLTPIYGQNGQFYRMKPDFYSEFLHTIDKEMAGNFMGIPDLTEEDKHKYISRSLIEESIASSQLEGANSSREAAKKMLLEGRSPRNYSERMIVNNHRTMLMIEKKYRHHPLSLEMVFELHRMITCDTLADNKQGVLRETLDEQGNRLVVKPWDDTTIAYVTPDQEFVKQELPRLIKFANNEAIGTDEFIHPLIRGIMLHFWIGLLHPFEDGNGRLGRALFYWYMLRNDYWAFAYLSLSEKIVKSPNQYAMAYIYSEQDDCDLTYFIHYNIEKLQLARKDFQRYAHNKIKENRGVVSVVQRNHDLNERQITLLQYLHRKKNERTSLVAHQNVYGVGKVTAAGDLRKLSEQGLLQKKRIGKNIYYYPTKEVENLFSL